MQPGSGILAVQKLYAGMPFSYSEDWFRYVVYSNPDWDLSTFTVSSAAAAEALNLSNIRTWPSSLAAFRSTGGKIISYHGQQDNRIICFNINRFYKHLLRGMKTSPDDMDVVSSASFTFRACFIAILGPGRGF